MRFLLVAVLAAGAVAQGHPTGMVWPQRGACVNSTLAAIVELLGPEPPAAWRDERVLRLCGGVAAGEAVPRELACGERFAFSELEPPRELVVHLEGAAEGVWTLGAQIDAPDNYWAPVVATVETASPVTGRCSGALGMDAPAPRFERVGLLVEPRPHPLLVATARNALAELPAGDDWGLQIMHGPASAALLQAEFGGDARVLLTPLPVDDMREARYCAHLTSPAFWAAVEGEVVLTLQTDAALCPRRPHTPRLRDFEQFAFTGAPWGGRVFPLVCWDIAVGRCVGNGGVSMRRRSAMLAATAQLPWNGLREDQWFASAMQTLGLRAAGASEARPFCAETVFSPFPVAVHKPWGRTMADPDSGETPEDYLSDEELASLVRQCPPLRGLMEWHAPGRLESLDSLGGSY